MKMTFKGTNELRKALKNKAFLESAQTVVKINGAELQAGAQKRAPVDTGNLKRSIMLELQDNRLTAVCDATAEYAPYVEWGTRFMRSQPYVGPAFYAQKKQFKRDMDKLVK